MLDKYDDRMVFERKLKDGFSEVAIGSGEWFGNIWVSERLAAVFAFYNIKAKTVGTVQHYEAEGLKYMGGGAVADPDERDYSEEEFNQFVEKREVKLGQRYDLAELISVMREPEPTSFT